MNKKTLIAGAAFVGLGVLTFTALRSPEKGQRTGEGPRPVARLKAADFDTLVVTKEGKATTLKRQGDGFAVVAPVSYPAEKDAAREAFEAVETLEFTHIVSDQKSKHAEFEVGDESLRVTAQKGEAKVVDLLIGKSLGAQTLVRLQGKDEVWQAKGSLKWKFDKDSAGWRDKTVLSFEEANVEGLEVKAADGSRIVLEKPAKPADAKAEGEAKDPSQGEQAGQPTPEGWRIVESSLPVDHLDKSIPDGMVNALYSFRANDFADAATAEETGLDAPRLTVTVKLQDDKNATLLIGKMKGEDEFYVKKEGGDQVFVVKKWNLDRANKRPIEFREKLICNVPAGDVQEVSVARKEDPFTLTRATAGTEEWKLTQPKGLALDTNKAATIAGSFGDWKAAGFAEATAPAATGLDKPVATITVKSKVKGAGCTLKVGAPSEDKSSYHVQVAGQGDVYLVPQWQVDRVLPKKDELTKKS